MWSKSRREKVLFKLFFFKKQKNNGLCLWKDTASHFTLCTLLFIPQQSIKSSAWILTQSVCAVDYTAQLFTVLAVSRILFHVNASMALTAACFPLEGGDCCDFSAHDDQGNALCSLSPHKVINDRKQQIFDLFFFCVCVCVGLHWTKSVYSVLKHFPCWQASDRPGVSLWTSDCGLFPVYHQLFRWYQMLKLMEFNVIAL